MHQPVIEGRSFPPRKPYEGSIYQVTKADGLHSEEGVPFRHSQLYMLHRAREMVQFCISLRHVEYKPGVQPSRPEGFDLLQAGRRSELQLRGRVAVPGAPKRNRNDAAPRRIFRESDTQCPRLTASHASGASGRFAHLLKNAPPIFEEEPARGAQLDAARQPVEQLEPQLGFQILNLRGQSRLSDMQPLRLTPVVFLFADGHEISEMPQFHTDILKRSV